MNVRSKILSLNKISDVDCDNDNELIWLRAKAKENVESNKSLAAIMKTASPQSTLCQEIQGERILSVPMKSKAVASAPNRKATNIKNTDLGRKPRKVTEKSKEQNKAKKNDADAILAQKRAQTRLYEKRREMHMIALQESEKKRQFDTFFRVKWRAGLKERRSEGLQNAVDRYILKDVIRNRPEALLLVDGNLDLNMSGVGPTLWHKLLADIALAQSGTEDGYVNVGDKGVNIMLSRSRSTRANLSSLR
jgi:hypothetical protein